MKNIISNFFSLSIINVIGMIIPILLIPFLTRTIGLELLAVVLLINTVVQFGIVVTDYSFNITGTRYIAANKGNISLILNEYAVIQRVKLIISLVYIFLSSSFLFFYLDINIIIITLSIIFGVIGNYFLAVWYYQGLSKLKAIALIASISKLIFFIFVIFFVNDKSDINLLIISYNLPLFIISSWYYFMYMHKQTSRITITLPSLHSKFINGFTVFSGDFAPNLYNNIPSIALGATTGGVSYTCYALATKITNAFVGFQYVLSRSIFPTIVGEGNAGLGVSLKLNIILIIPFLLAIGLFSEEIVLFFLGESSTETVFYLKILTISVCFNAVINIINQGYLLPNNKDKIFRNISVTVSVLSALLGVLLIYFYGIPGLVYTQLLARSLLAISTVFYLKFEK